MTSIPRAPSLEKPRMQMDANPNKVGHGSHWGLVPYDNNKWKCKLEIKKKKKKIFWQSCLLYTLQPLWYIYINFKKTTSKLENINTSSLCRLCSTSVTKKHSSLHSRWFVSGTKSSTPKSSRPKLPWTWNPIQNKKEPKLHYFKQM